MTLPLVIIAGPTAAGKSTLALMLADRFRGELVSADSAQVYRRLDVGTAKPTADERLRVPHHLVDVADLHEDYDAGRFVHEADAAITAIRARGHLPIVVGGTGMYIRALMYGLIEAPGADPVVRAHLEARASSDGLAALHAELVEVDPAGADKIHPNDAVRIIRALEVHQVTGRPLGDHHREHDIRSRPPRHQALSVVIAPPREALYARIDARVDAMLEGGWSEEVKALLDDGVDPDSRPMQIMGYRHLVAWLMGRCDDAPWSEIVRLIKRDHRRYAKRQMTWFRAQPDFQWFEDAQAALDLLESRLEA